MSDSEKKQPKGPFMKKPHHLDGKTNAEKRRIRARNAEKAQHKRELAVTHYWKSRPRNDWEWEDRQRDMPKDALTFEKLMEVSDIRRLLFKWLIVPATDRKIESYYTERRDAFKRQEHGVNERRVKKKNLVFKGMHYITVMFENIRLIGRTSKQFLKYCDEFFDTFPILLHLPSHWIAPHKAKATVSKILQYNSPKDASDEVMAYVREVEKDMTIAQNRTVSKERRKKEKQKDVEYAITTGVRHVMSKITPKSGQWIHDRATRFKKGGGRRNGYDDDYGYGGRQPARGRGANRRGPNGLSRDTQRHIVASIPNDWKPVEKWTIMRVLTWKKPKTKKDQWGYILSGGSSNAKSFSMQLKSAIIERFGIKDLSFHVHFAVGDDATHFEIEI